MGSTAAQSNRRRRDQSHCFLSFLLLKYLGAAALEPAPRAREAPAKQGMWRDSEREGGFKNSHTRGRRTAIRLRYAAPAVHLYAPLRHPDDDRELVHRLRADQPLLAQLRAAQPLGYVIPGVPIVHVVVGGSEYERQFFLNKLAR